MGAATCWDRGAAVSFKAFFTYFPESSQKLTGEVVFLLTLSLKYSSFCYIAFYYPVTCAKWFVHESNQKLNIIKFGTKSVNIYVKLQQRI